MFCKETKNFRRKPTILGEIKTTKFWKETKMKNIIVNQNKSFRRKPKIWKKTKMNILEENQIYLEETKTSRKTL